MDVESFFIFSSNGDEWEDLTREGGKGDGGFGRPLEYT
jgi:hypothetical protein